MNIDLNLVVKILEEAQKNVSVRSPKEISASARDNDSPKKPNQGLSDKEVHHYQILFEIGLIDGEDISESVYYYKFVCTGITFNGHRFLEMWRDDKIMNHINKKIGGVGIHINDGNYRADHPAFSIFCLLNYEP